MSRTLYACAHAAEFPLQALLRLRPELHSAPVVVLEGPAEQKTVCALNRHARRSGATPGMTRLEAESIRGLHLLSRSVESETAARAVFRECVANFSPRIEEASGETACAFELDIAGTGRLFGPPESLAQRMRAALAAAGLRASIAVSANYDAALLKAAASRGITLIPEGEEARALEKLPIAALKLPEDHRETFALWGIGTLGELAALPEAELVSRLGAQARLWRERARGVSAHAFQPIEREFSLEELCEFESPVEQMDSLLFIGARMIGSLVERAAGRALSLASLAVHMKLEGGLTHQRLIRPALPSADRKFLLKLLQLEIGAHPPSAAVVSLTLKAEAGQPGKVQLGLFAPQTPEPSRLDVTLARLKAMVGEDRVGSPMLQDTHRARSFRMQDFSVAGKPPAPTAEPPRLALRPMRPPLPVCVVLNAMRPAAFRDGENRYEVTAAYGPWRTSGCWWSAGAWNVEEWDVLAETGNGVPVACLLVCERPLNAWRLEAFYD